MLPAEEGLPAGQPTHPQQTTGSCESPLLLTMMMLVAVCCSPRCLKVPLLAEPFERAFLAFAAGFAGCLHRAHLGEGRVSRLRKKSRKPEILDHSVGGFPSELDEAGCCCWDEGSVLASDNTVARTCSSHRLNLTRRRRRCESRKA